MTKAKICGVSTPEAVDAAVSGGAAFLGFNFFPKSPRYVTPETAGRLAERVRQSATKVVAVTVDLDDATLGEIVRVSKPDLIQMHGHETEARVTHIKVRYGLGVIKVLSVSDAADLAPAAGFDGLVEHLMFDAKVPKGSAMPGGMGASFDWDILAGRSYERPYLLAGGLDPWNVAEAVRRSGAPLVDVSSGVERGPGLKDAALITAFLDAVKRT